MKTVNRRNSGYERKERDFYSTPAWVTDVLLKHVRLPRKIWEPACGSGKMSKVLAEAGHNVFASDIEPLESSGATVNFLADRFTLPPICASAVVTNPPFCLAEEFVWQALAVTEPEAGIVCMLLPSEFDYAGGRAGLIEGCPQFARKIVLRRRISWFAGTADDKGKQPMGVHAWYIWDWRHYGPAMTDYMRPEKKVAAKPRKLAKALALAA